MFDVYDTIISMPAILIAVSFHEFAHAYVANLFGDDTAEKMCRLTVNPFKHLDLMGTIMFLFFGFGWAKPVPVNESKFKTKRIGIFLVSIAGIVVNIIIGIIFSFVWIKISVGNDKLQTLKDIFYNIAFINIAFATFNLIPIPPLDGYRVISAFFSNKFRYYFYKYENYGMIILAFLLLTGSIEYILNPIASFVFSLVSYIIF